MSIAEMTREELVEEIGYLRGVIANMEAYNLAHMPIKPDMETRYFAAGGDSFNFDGPYATDEEAIASFPGAEYVRIISVRAPADVEVEVEYWEEDIEQEDEE